MIAWSDIDAALSTAIATASGVSDVKWRWESPSMRQAERIYLERGPVTVLGIDERRQVGGTAQPWTFAQAFPLGVTPDPDAYQVGQRSFQLEVRVETHRGMPSNTAPVDAADILSRLVTRIRRPTILADLVAAGMSLSAIGQIVRQAYNDGTRDVRAAVVSLTFLCADVDLDGADYFIETVNGDLVVARPDGNDVTTPFSATVVP